MKSENCESRRRVRPDRTEFRPLKPKHRGVLESLEPRALMAVLQAGDANQDYYFDESDFIFAHKAGKFEGVGPATWAEGDWNGAPGGQPGSPPQGDGVFNSADYVAAFQSGTYRLGAYATPASQPIDARQRLIRGHAGDIVVSYNASNGEILVDTKGISLSTFQLRSRSNIFASNQDVVLLLFDTNEATNQFRLSPSGLPALRFLASPGLSQDQLLSELTVDGSRIAGGGLGTVSFICPLCEIGGTATIQGQVFGDTNGNGVRDDGERGLDRQVLLENVDLGFSFAARTVSVDLDGDGQIHPESETGIYKFSNLSARAYVVRPESVLGDFITSPVDGSHVIDVADGQQISGKSFAIQLLPYLRAGDANQDLHFNEADLIQVFKAGRFLTGAAATWTEGDWNGGPGGAVGQPPIGDGRFDTVDIFAADIDRYRKGGYDERAGAPIDRLSPLTTRNDTRLTLQYDSLLKTLTIDTHGQFLSTFHVHSRDGLLAGSTPDYVDPNLNSFEIDTPHDIFRISATHQAMERLTVRTKERYSLVQMLADLRIDGSWRTDGNTMIEYDFITGSLNVASPETRVTAFEIVSASQQLRPENVDPTIFSGIFDVKNPGKVFKLVPGGFGTSQDPLVLYGILPAGLTRDQLEKDLAIGGAVFPQGQLRHSLLVKGNPNEIDLPGNLGPVGISCICGVGDGSINGQIFDDLNRNGVRDPGEQPLNDWTVQLTSVDRGIIIESIISSSDVNGNGSIEPSEEGTFHFNHLPAGEYTVTSTPTRAFELETPEKKTLTVSLGADQQVQNLTFAARRTPTAILRGQAFADTNRNGIREAGEVGENNIQLTAVDKATGELIIRNTGSLDLNQDGKINPESEQGWYRFDFLEGQYEISITSFDDNASTNPTKISRTFGRGEDALVDISVRRVARGDFNHDSRIDITDLDLLMRGIRNANDRTSEMDLTADSTISFADARFLIHSILNTSLGDVNLDRRFDSRDLVQVLQAGEYEDSLEDNSSWSEGDWNGDGDFDAFDLVVALQEGRYVGATPAVTSPIESPETGASARAWATQRVLASIPLTRTLNTPTESPNESSSDAAGQVDITGQAIFQAAAIDHAVVILTELPFERLRRKPHTHDNDSDPLETRHRLDANVASF